MCEDCFEKNIMRFPSQEEYDNFMSLIYEKVNSNKLKFNDSLENTNNILGIDFRTYVTCKTCAENWVLETPDHANRGYFLNQDGIEIYYTNKDQYNQKVRRNGLIILVLVLIITAYKCT